MSNLDLPFFAAALAFGWGLSLATYRIFAVRNDWPMGELHANKPLVPVLLGVFALAIAFLFAAFRAATPATELGGWWILPAGLLVGVLLDRLHAGWIAGIAVSRADRDRHFGVRLDQRAHPAKLRPRIGLPAEQPDQRHRQHLVCQQRRTRQLARQQLVGAPNGALWARPSAA